MVSQAKLDIIQSEFMSLPTRERFVILSKDLKRVRSLPKMREILAEKLGGSDLEKFSAKIGNNTWHGFQYKNHNTMMGSIFSFYNNKLTILRGYPKIRYVEDAQVLNREGYQEVKLDGTNLNLWTFHDGILFGKTRLSHRWDVQGWSGKVWKDIFDTTGLVESTTKLCNDGYQVFFELYGENNPAEFIRYSFPIKATVIDILDRKTFGFVSREEKETLCKKYNIPVAELYWKGTLTLDEAKRLEFEMKSKLVIDGIEGLVAKVYDTEHKDVLMAKIKCQEVREKCYTMSGGVTVPRTIIYKAIKKAKDNSSFTDKDQLISFITAELLEDYSEEMVARSKQKIKNAIYDKFTTPERFDEIFVYLDELSIKQFDMMNTGLVMRNLADKYIGYQPNKLFTILNIYRQNKGLVK
jgi:ATP-dependent RNA circularization protein (DNA/RNA ligase family)